MTALVCFFQNGPFRSSEADSEAGVAAVAAAPAPEKRLAAGVESPYSMASSSSSMALLAAGAEEEGAKEGAVAALRAAADEEALSPGCRIRNTVFQSFCGSFTS